MARLGMEHAVQQTAAHHHACTHAGTDGQVDDGIEAARATERRLAQAGDVDVGVVAHGDVAAGTHGAEEVIAAPARLGRIKHMTVLGTRGVDRGGPEGTDAHGVHLALGKPGCHLGHDLLGRRSGQGLALKYRAVLGPHGQHHLGAARLQCSDPLTHGHPLSCCQLVISYINWIIWYVNMRYSLPGERLISAVIR